MKDQPVSEYGGPATPQPASWSQDRRLKLIDFRLRWEGRVNRGDLIEYFGISAPQASADLSKYTDAAPFNLTYDMKLKSYVRTDSFAPLYARSSSRAYLNELLALTTGVVDRKASFIGWLPEVGVAPTPHRLLDGRTLAMVLQSIRERRRLALGYQGMNRPEPTQREISPHALGFDGFRWHVRAYCHLRAQYQDFVIGRMVDASVGDETDRTGKDDDQWNTVLRLVLAPHPDLSPGAKRAIRMEYGMVDGTMELHCRQALLFYALRRLGLQPQHDKSAAAVQQIVLLNQAELQPYLTKVQGKDSA